MFPDVHILADHEAMSRAAAKRCRVQADEALRAHGRFAFVLTGGSTPRRFYQLLAGPYRDQIPWQQTHLFWGDERYVPPEHPESNYGMARTALVDRVPIPEQQVHPVPTGHETPGEAAAAYEETLQRFAEARPAGAPLFDLLLLGLGADAHVASLFPEDAPHRPADRRWVRAVQAPPRHSPQARLTLTLAALNEAHEGLFLVSGEKKRDAVQAVLREQAPSKPATHVRPKRRLHWFLDEAAAGHAG